MNNKNNFGKLKERMFITRALKGSLVALAIFVLGFVLLPTLRSEANAAINVGFDADWGAVDLIFDPDVAATDAGESEIGDLGHGDVEFGSIIPTEQPSGISSAADGNVGTLNIVKKTLGITSRGKFYEVFLSMTGNSNSLETTDDSGFTIDPITGTFATPGKYSRTGWGVAIPGISSKVTGTTEFATQTYNSKTIYDNPDVSMTYDSDGTGSGTIYKNVTWAQVPVHSNPQMIWKNTTASPDGFNSRDTFDVYYSVNANTDTIAGTYENQVIYTALASADAIDSVSSNVARSVAYGTGGESQTLTFDLAESIISSEITASNVKVYLVKHSDMSAVNFNPANLASTVTKYECPVTAFSATNNRSTVTCTMPNANGEVADSSANIATTAGQEGRYDFWIKLTLSSYEHNYVSKLANGALEGFAFVGLQSRYKDPNDNNALKNYVTEMQEMTPAICNNVTP